MPAWLVPIIVKIAIELGMPFIRKYLPMLPEWALDILKSLEGAIADPKVDNREAKKVARVALKERKAMATVGRAPDTV